MLSQISWPQFWLFIAVATSSYYLVIILMYFRSETISTINGGFARKKSNSVTSRPSGNPIAVIGSFEKEPRPTDKEEKTLFSPSINPENSDSAPENQSHATPGEDDVYQKVNESLLGDALLSEEFIARVNAGLEDEIIEEQEDEPDALSIPEEGEEIDAQDFFKIIEQGLEGLDDTKQVEIKKTALYKEIFTETGDETPTGR